MSAIGKDKDLEAIGAQIKQAKQMLERFHELLDILGSMEGQLKQWDHKTATSAVEHTIVGLAALQSIVNLKYLEAAEYLLREQKKGNR